MNGGKLGTIIFPIVTTQQVITAEEKQSCFVVDIQNKDRRSLVILYVLFVTDITAVEVLWFSRMFSRRYFVQM